MANKTNTASQKPRSAKTFLWVAAITAFLSVIDHFYLLNEHIALRYGEATGQSMCEINALFSCSAVSASKYAEFLGVPIALWGAIANLVLFLLIAWLPFTDDDKKPAAHRNILIVSGFIALTSIVMGAISSIALGKLCPFCIVAYVLSFITFIFVWLAVRKSGSTSQTLKGRAFQFSDFTPVLVLAAIGAVAGFIGSDQMTKPHKADSLKAYAVESVGAWTSAPQLQIATTEPLVYGASRETAKMIIQEFADFRCIHCKHAAPVLKAFVNAHKDVRLEFQAWPLDGECNTAISQANGASCLLARIAYCAGTKGEAAGWAAHEYLFENSEKYSSVDGIRADIPAAAKAAGLSSDELAQCADSEKAKTTIQAQSANGTALNIQGTPAIFVNSKKLEGGQLFPVLSRAYESLSK